MPVGLILVKLTSSLIKLSRLSYFKLNYFANNTYYKLSECEDVSIINIIQVKFSCFLCQIVLYDLQGLG